MNDFNGPDMNPYNLNRIGTEGSRGINMPQIPGGIPPSNYGTYMPGAPQYQPGMSPSYIAPNLNYSIPNYNLNNSFSGRGNPSYLQGNMGPMVPYGMGINPPNTMMQNTINMANEIDVYQPEVQRNQYLI